MRTAVQRIDGLVKIGVVHQRFGARVLQNVGDFSGDQAPVDRHHHRADLGDSEVGLHKFDTVLEQGSDPVAGTDTLGEQAVGHAIGAGVELGEGEAAVALEFHEGFAVGTDFCALFQEQPDICFHHRYCRQWSYAGQYSTKSMR